jgi:hypothetical protein
MMAFMNTSKYVRAVLTPASNPVQICGGLSERLPHLGSLEKLKNLQKDDLYANLLEVSSFRS